jgi:hypothetical protein
MGVFKYYCPVCDTSFSKKNEKKQCYEDCINIEKLITKLLVTRYWRNATYKRLIRKVVKLYESKKDNTQRERIERLVELSNTICERCFDRECTRHTRRSII